MVNFLARKLSKIHGLGVFTSKDIAEGELFYEVPVDNILHYAKRRCAYVGNNVWVSDEFVLNYINHSCNPNAVLDISGDVPKLVSIKDIKNGEEITVDYNSTEEGGTLIPCSCGAEGCKGEFMTILGPGQVADVLPEYGS
jgi:SET domain-containing protein